MFSLVELRSAGIGPGSVNRVELSSSWVKLALKYYRMELASFIRVELISVRVELVLS
jgi:hypothetical protein